MGLSVQVKALQLYRVLIGETVHLLVSEDRNVTNPCFLGTCVLQSSPGPVPNRVSCPPVPSLKVTVLRVFVFVDTISDIDNCGFVVECLP